MNLGNVRIDIDVERLEEQVKELEKEVDKAVQDELASIASDSLTEAKNHIRRNDKVWNKQVLNNWVPIRERTPFGVHVSGYQNYSQHAAAIDEGATWDDKKPNIDALRVYVADEYNLHDEQAIDRAAYGVMRHLWLNGMEGINYTGKAEKYAQKVGPTRLKNAIERNAGD